MLFCEVRDLTPPRDTINISREVETLAQRFGLTTKLKSEKTKHVHWHFGRKKEAGVLEVTFDASKQTLVVSVHRNREGIWARVECPRFASALARQLHARVSPAYEE